MSEPSKDKDQEKGDEVLRRLLKTPPTPHEKGKAPVKPARPNKPRQDDKKR
ncbi:hypothetical protein [Mesorhizobium sp. M0816]|uniref:hypothetical protein n=1 Tax=Mesorhizobium sp. M0816 TaxID=2957006 RepID=UPI003335759C